MAETVSPEHDVHEFLLDGIKDVRRLLALRRAQAESPDQRRQLERVVVELMETPTLDGEELSAEQSALLVGAGLWALGRVEEAIANLVSASGPEADYFVGRCYLDTGLAKRAVEAFERASRGKAVTKHLAALGHAEATAKAGRPDAALTELRALAKAKADDPDIHYLLGLCHDQTGRYDAAAAAYEQALKLDPDHLAASFRIAFKCARRGEEAQALEHYEAIAAQTATYANALLNLGILYEDRRDYDKAIVCYRRVLHAEPTHARARMFLKDTHASLDMVYDEDHERDLDRRSKLLTIPVSDFELSVRVRNCLQRMNIFTVGELVHHTEEELLASKNFGDTSLQEIKEMLAARNLRLGQDREDVEEAAAAAEAGDGEAVPTRPADEAILQTPISDLDLSIRSRKCMERLGIATLGQLADHTAEELLGSRNFGRTSLVEVAEKLSRYGLRLKEPPPPSLPEEEDADDDEGEEDQDAQ